MHLEAGRAPLSLEQDRPDWRCRWSSVIASEAKQSSGCPQNSLDCFAASLLAMPCPCFQSARPHSNGGFRPIADSRPTCPPCSLSARTLTPRLRAGQVAGSDRITVCAEFLPIHRSQDGLDRRCLSPRTCRSSGSSGGVCAELCMIAPCPRRAGPSGTRYVSTSPSG